MKLKHRIFSALLVPVILVVMTLSPFEKEVHAEVLTIGTITLIMSILSACGVAVNFMMSDVFPKTGGFDPVILDSPTATLAEKQAMISELNKINIPNSNFAKMALDKVGEKLKPFADKIQKLVTPFTLSGMAAIIGVGVAELMDRAKTGKLDLNAEQTVAMQKFMNENFGELMVGDVKVMDGNMVTFADMMNVYTHFPLEVGTPAKTKYYTNTRTNVYFNLNFRVSSVVDNFDFDFMFFNVQGGVFKLLGGFNTLFNYYDFGNDYGDLYYKFVFDNFGDFRTNFYNTLNVRTGETQPRVVNSISFTSRYYPGSSTIINFLPTDVFIVSTDAPTLTATGGLNFPQTDLPLTLPNTLTGGVSIPISQTMAEANTKALTDAIARAGGIDVPGEIPPIPPIIPPDTPNFMMPGNIINKFPFSIPFDIVKGARLLVAPPTTPKFDIAFEIPLPSALSGGSIPVNFTIDLTPFDKIAAMCRTFATLIFTVGLAVATPKLVKGAR